MADAVSHFLFQNTGPHTAPHAAPLTPSCRAKYQPLGRTFQSGKGAVCAKLCWMQALGCTTLQRVIQRGGDHTPCTHHLLCSSHVLLLSLPHAPFIPMPPTPTHLEATFIASPKQLNLRECREGAVRLTHCWVMCQQGSNEDCHMPHRVQESNLLQSPSDPDVL